MTRVPERSFVRFAAKAKLLRVQNLSGCYHAYAAADRNAYTDPIEDCEADGHTDTDATGRLRQRCRGIGRRL